MKYLLLPILLLLTTAAHAEVITLNSGKVIKAKIVEKTDQYIRVDFSGVKLTYYLDTIASIRGDEGDSVKTVSEIPPLQPPSIKDTPIHVDVSQERQDPTVAKRPIPRRQEDIQLSDYVKVEYGPGENINNLVIDPTHALNALGLKVDKTTGGLEADYQNPNGSGAGSSFSTMGQALKITTLIICAVSMILYFIKQRMG